MILGIDEVGRGCWAGPLCVGAVIIGNDTDRTLLADSKKLSAKKRSIAARHIQTTAISIGIGWASAKYIDSYGLSAALKYATAAAVDQVKAEYSEIILDGTVNFLPGRTVTLLPKADGLIPAVSAASIVAKVARDNYMKAINDRFAGYGFGAHVGYGTAQHRQAIDIMGPSLLHRMTFSPLSQIKQMPAAKMKSTGATAEGIAADFLVSKGFRIIDRNWKTKWCEIDIIAEKDNEIYFTEVKYRSRDTSGRGLEYITDKKQRQMKFAAELWQLQTKSNMQCRLAALELSGEEFSVTEFLETL